MGSEPGWLELPKRTVSLPRELGLPGALALQLGVFALVVALSVVIEWRRHGRLDPTEVPGAIRR